MVRLEREQEQPEEAAFFRHSSGELVRVDVTVFHEHVPHLLPPPAQDFCVAFLHYRHHDADAEAHDEAHKGRDHHPKGECELIRVVLVGVGKGVDSDVLVHRVRLALQDAHLQHSPQWPLQLLPLLGAELAHGSRGNSGGPDIH